jgi:hypothetical protein
MPISIEEVYIGALKTQMKKWKKEIRQKEEGSNNVIQEKETPEHVMSIIKTFLFDQTLYTEITKAALLMCDKPERQLQPKIQELIAYVHTYMTNEVDVFGAWNILKIELRYGDDGDDGNNEVWIDLGALPERVKRRAIPDIAVRRLRNSGGDPETIKKQQIQEASEPSDNLDGPKLRVKLYIVGGRNWDMPPITQQQRIGLELLHVVPFDNWEGLHCSIDRGNEQGDWFEMYSGIRERNSVRTPAQIQRDVREKLDKVQTEAFEALQRDSTTILSLYLGTKGVFEIPEKIQPWTGAGLAMPDNVDSLLTTLKTYV